MSDEPQKLRASQCTFTANMELRERQNEEQRSTPFTAVARTGEALNHAYWGRVVHDLDGMQHKPRVPIDFNHDVNTIVGYANKFDTDTGDLKLGGAITPSKHEQNSRAEEIIDKGEQGVPWEMSINFAGDLEVENIPDQEAVTVNQREFTGPLTVIRKWSLRGVAVTPYGHDSGTSLNFADDPTINITVLNKEPDMADQTTGTEADVVVDEAVEVADPDTVEAVADEAPAVDTDEKVEEESEAVPMLSETDPKTFMSEFGRVQGALYFADGISIDEARKLEIKRLAQENASLRARINESEGLEEPLEFSQSKDGGVESDVLTAIPGDRVDM